MLKTLSLIEKKKSEELKAKKEEFTAPKHNLCSRLRQRIHQSLLESGGEVQQIQPARK